MTTIRLLFPDGAGADALVVRALALADAGAAAAAIRSAFAAQSRATTPPSSALRETSESVAAKIAAGGGFGGFVDAAAAAIALWRVDDDALMIGRVCVLPAFRGRGAAARLVAACEGAARAQRLARLRLRTRLELPENERLFSRMGFARVRVEAHEGFAAPTTAVLEKDL